MIQLDISVELFYTELVFCILAFVYLLLSHVKTGVTYDEIHVHVGITVAAFLAKI